MCVLRMCFSRIKYRKRQRNYCGTRLKLRLRLRLREVRIEVRLFSLTFADSASDARMPDDNLIEGSLA